MTKANDLSMIDGRGLGVAMQSAVPAVKAVANVITPMMTNDRKPLPGLSEEYDAKKGELDMRLFDRLFRKKKEPKIEDIVKKLWKTLDSSERMKPNGSQRKKLLRKRQQETKWKKHL